MRAYVKFGRWLVVLGVCLPQSATVYGEALNQPMMVSEPRCAAEQTCAVHQCNREQCGCRAEPNCNPPGRPRGGEGGEPTPRGAEGPGVSPGVYVAPPQTGETVSPTRGLELGGMSLTLPEMTFNMPKLKFRGITRFVRNGHMRLDSGNAPWVANPMAAMGTQAGLVGQPGATGRGGDPNDSTPRDAPNPPAPVPRDGHPTPNTCPPAPSCKAQADARMDKLERCVEEQCKVLQVCINRLSTPNAMANGSPAGNAVAQNMQPHPQSYEAQPKTFAPTYQDANRAPGDNNYAPQQQQQRPAYNQPPVPYSNPIPEENRNERSVRGTARRDVQVGPATYYEQPVAEYTAVAPVITRLPPVWR